jgi:hypothetical protein
MAPQREAWPQRYQIRVRGQLGETVCSAFPALQARVDGGVTVLTGVLADQAALYGVLAEVEALGLELIDVHRLPLTLREVSRVALVAAAAVRAGGGEQAEGAGTLDGLGPAVGAELGVQVADVSLDGVR